MQALKRKEDESDRMSASTPPGSMGDRSTSSQGKYVGGVFAFQQTYTLHLVCYYFVKQPSHLSLQYASIVGTLEVNSSRLKIEYGLRNLHFDKNFI